jgi:MFS family permease
VLCSIIGEVGFSFLSGCFEAIMYDSLKASGREMEMQKVAGLNGSFALAATMAGSLIGGFITADLRLSHFVHSIVLTAFFVFLSFLAGFLLKEPSLKRKQEGGSSYILVRDGLHLIKTNRSLQRIIILSLLTTPFINYLLNFYPPYFVKANVRGYFFGITLAVASLTGACASRYAYLLEKLLGVKKGVFLALISPGLLYFLLSVVYHPVLSIVLVILSCSSMYTQKPIFTDSGYPVDSGDHKL